MNLGFSETAFLVVLGLLLFGPKKLPEIGRQIGRVMAEFKRASNEFQSQLSDEVRQFEQEIDDTKRTILPPMGSEMRAQPRVAEMEANSGDHPGEAPATPEAPVVAHVVREPNA